MAVTEEKSDNTYTMSFIRTDGDVGSTQVSGWGAELLVYTFFQTIKSNKRILFAVVIDDNGVIKHEHNASPGTVVFKEGL